MNCTNKSQRTWFEIQQNPRQNNIVTARKTTELCSQNAKVFFPRKHLTQGYVHNSCTFVTPWVDVTAPARLIYQARRATFSWLARVTEIHVGKKCTRLAPADMLSSVSHCFMQYTLCACMELVSTGSHRFRQHAGFNLHQQLGLPQETFRWTLILNQVGILS